MWQDQVLKQFAVGYGLNVNYDPVLNAKNELENFKQYDMYVEHIGSGVRLVKDVKITKDKPLALVTSTLDNGKFSFLYFTPKGGKIYCIKAEVVLGNWVGRPNISFAEQAYCEKAFRKYQMKEEEK